MISEVNALASSFALVKFTGQTLNSLLCSASPATYVDTFLSREGVDEGGDRTRSRSTGLYNGNVVLSLVRGIESLSFLKRNTTAQEDRNSKDTATLSVHLITRCFLHLMNRC